MSYVVYKHTTPNGKVYIGITGANPKIRWGHGANYTSQHFHNAIKKYGWDNIKHDILFEGLSKEQAEQKEIELIALYKSNQREYGYNVSIGGGGRGPQSQETIEKIRKAQINKYVSEETKQKISKANKGRKVDLIGRKNISLAHIGIKHTEESKKKIGDASKNRKPRLGMKNSQESKEKVSKKLKGRENTWNRKKVIQIEKSTNKIIKIFDYIKQAQIETGIDYGSIVAVCRGKRKTAGGYKWKYVEEV